MFFASPGAVLDVPGLPLDDALLDGWRMRVQRAGTRLGWGERRTAVRRHAKGTVLALTAPRDLLLLATDINEWALCATLVERDPLQWQLLDQALVSAAFEAADGPADPGASDPPVIEETAALARFERLARAQALPRLTELIDAATARQLPYVIDETELTLGAGLASRTFPVDGLPSVAAAPWNELRDIPTALVTGSNGKTTTVRLLAACAQAHGWHTAYNCTDGVYLDGEMLASGDYSGPAGARLVLREPRTQAAILETARGGILRRGLAVSQAQVAVVTNVSPDHFGEFGIDDLAGLAEVKLTVSAALGTRGLLVLNAEDRRLRDAAANLTHRFGHRPELGWFSAEPESVALVERRAGGAPTCGVREGTLQLHHAGLDHDLGRIAAMPLSLDGVARYNIENMAGAALAAAALGIPASTIARVLGRFGAQHGDNPGRMMRFLTGGVTVLVDYAHNPDGLRGLLTVAAHLRRGTGRLGLLLGQAGNRQDADVEQLVQVAAGFQPDLVVIKENHWQLRGRAPGEMPRLIRSHLHRLGFSDASLADADNEVDAARHALTWSRPGDVLAFPLHSSNERAAVVTLLESLPR